VDGNAIRVLSRVFNVQQPADSSAGKAKLWKLALENLPAGKAADYNQALMDLGARICTPRSPNCAGCPLAVECKARRLGIQEQRPVKGKEKVIPMRHFVAAAILQKGEVLVVQRPSRGLLAGMWEFPNLETKRSPRLGLRRIVRDSLGLDLQSSRRLGEYDHAYSHFRVRLQAFEIKLNGTRPQVRGGRIAAWVRPAALSKLPMGKLDRTLANELIKNGN
jgi:A/G-specific adenine glycosylase